MKKSAKLALFFSVMFTLVSCQGFLQSESVKNEIYSVIEYNNAPSYKIKFDSEKNRGTFKAPTGIETQKKVTDSFTVSFAPANDYDFLYWKIMDAASKTEYPNGEYLTLESVTSDTTTCKFTKAPQNGIQLTLFAVVAKRPRVISKYPQTDSVTYRDTRIRIVFDKAMDENSIYFDQNDMDSLKKQLGIEPNNYLNAGTTANPKYYCYLYNGKKYYKNIQIANANEPDTSILEYFDAPYFEDPTTLIIPPNAKSYLPPNTTITVTLEAGFSYSYTYSNNTHPNITKSLMLKEDEIWLFSVNSSTDKTAPDGSETLTDSENNAISTTKDKPTTLYQQKLKMYVNVSDPGSGPFTTFKMCLTNMDLEDSEPQYIPLAYDSFPDSRHAYLGSEDEKAEYTFIGLPENKCYTYKLNFIYYDNNNNPTTQPTDYYIKIDTRKPDVKNMTLEDFETDETSINSNKTALQLKYSYYIWNGDDNTRLDKIEVTYEPEDKSEDSVTKSFADFTNNPYPIIQNLTHGKNYTFDIKFYNKIGNCLSIIGKQRTKVDYVKKVNFSYKPTIETYSTGTANSNSVTMGAITTLTWEKPDGDFDSYTIKYQTGYDGQKVISGISPETVQYTLPFTLAYEKTYAFQILTEDEHREQDFIITTPLSPVIIKDIRIREMSKNPYLQVSSSIISPSSSKTAELYYSETDFEPKDSNRNKLSKINMEVQINYLYVNTSIGDNSTLKLGNTYYFAIRYTDGKNVEWSETRKYIISYYDVYDIKASLVASKNAIITWTYAEKLQGKTVDWVKIYRKGKSEPIWSKSNIYIQSLKETGSADIGFLEPDAENTIEIRMSYNGTETYKFVKFKTFKEIPGFGDQDKTQAVYTDSSQRYVKITYNWNTPSVPVEKYIITCKKASETDFKGVNGALIPQYLYMNRWTVENGKTALDGTATSFTLESYHGETADKISINEEYDLLITGYIVANNQAVEVVKELYHIKFQ